MDAPRQGLLSNLPTNARWPLRLFLGASLALGLGLGLLDAGARPWLIGAFLGTGLLLGYTIWDETRGRAHRLNELRKRWLDFGAGDGGSLEDGISTRRPTGLTRADLHLMEDGQPLIARLGLHGRDATPTVAILTPLPETTTAFLIASKHLPRPGFDGLEPVSRGPTLEPLPGVGALLEQTFHVMGNDPTRITRLLDEDLRHALAETDTLHRSVFRGLTFDGRFLAVHLLGEDLASDPAKALALSRPLWRPFVPRLPPLPRTILH